MHSLQTTIVPLNAWKLSKVVHREVFLDGSIATSGPGKDRLLEKIRESRNYLQSSAIIMKVLSAVFALAIYAMTILGMVNAYLPGIHNEIFSLSASTAIVFVFQFMFVFTYGMIGLIGFFSSSAFKYLHTLPISKKKIQATAYFTYFRLINWQMVSIFLGLPIASGLGMYILPIAFQDLGIFITVSWLDISLSVLCSLVISFVNIIFLFSLMLTVSLYIAKKLYKPTGGSKIQTILQLIVSLLYAIVSLGAGLAVTYLVDLVQGGFIIGPQGGLINIILNFTIYPFGLTHLYSIFHIGILRGWAIIPIANIWIAIGGFILTIGVTYLLFRRSMKILSSLTKEEIHTGKHNTKIDVILKLEVYEPIKAIYKKDMSYIFRNFSSTLYFIFPILMPLVLLIQVFGIETTGYDALFEIVMFTFFYSGMTISFAIMCVTAPESETGGLLYLLPSKMRDIYRVKRRIMFISMAISALAPILIMIINSLSNSFQLSEDPILPSILLSISCLVIYFYGIELALFMYSRFFGKMRNKYTIQMLNVKNKILKIIFGVIILYVVSYVPLVAGYFLGIVFGGSVLYGSMIMLGTALIFAVIFSILAYKNFNSH